MSRRTRGCDGYISDLCNVCPDRRGCLPTLEEQGIRIVDASQHFDILKVKRGEMSQETFDGLHPRSKYVGLFSSNNGVGRI